MVKHTSGVICVPMEGAELDRLELPLMTPPAANTERMRTAYTISVDAAEGVTTGISAADRARTIRLLADPASHGARSRRVPATFSRCATATAACCAAPATRRRASISPGMAGLRSGGRAGGNRQRRWHHGARAELLRFKEQHGLKFCTIQDLIAYRSQTREARRTRGSHPSAHRLRRFPALPLPQQARRQTPPRPRQGHHR